MSCCNLNDLCPRRYQVPAFCPVQPCCPCLCPPFPPIPPCPPKKVPSYAFYYTTGPQNVPAGRCVNFGTGISTPGISLFSGDLSFGKPGVYLIQYKISLINPCPGTTIGLVLNGFFVVGSMVITTMGTEYSGQAIVTVPNNGIVSLKVSGPVVVRFVSVTAICLS